MIRRIVGEFHVKLEDDGHHSERSEVDDSLGAELDAQSLVGHSECCTMKRHWFTPVAASLAAAVDARLGGKRSEDMPDAG